MDFILLDLEAQAKAVKQYTIGWDAQTILEWLGTNGKVSKVRHPLGESLYLFESSIGIVTGFRIPENGQLVILLNHTTFLP